MITDNKTQENMSVPLEKIENIYQNQLDQSLKDKTLKSPTISLASRLNLRYLENQSMLLHQLSYLSYELIENK